MLLLHTRTLLKTTWCTDKLLLGASQVELDFEVLCSVAAMLYGSSFVAERYSGIRSFLEQGKKVRLSVYTRLCLQHTQQCTAIPLPAVQTSLTSGLVIMKHLCTWCVPPSLTSCCASA